MAQFDYSGIRTLANELLAKFGNYNTPAVLLRTVEASAPDASKPWRLDEPDEILQFPFIGYDKTVEFSTGDPVYDEDHDIIIPGSILTTAATGDPLTLCGEPKMTDRILLDGDKQFQILGLVPIKGAGVPIIIKARLKAWPLLTKQPSTPF